MRQSLEAIAASIQAESVFGSLPGGAPSLPARREQDGDDGSAAVVSLLS
jgi:hypothetical protein